MYVDVEVCVQTVIKERGQHQASVLTFYREMGLFAVCCCADQAS